MLSKSSKLKVQIQYSGFNYSLEAFYILWLYRNLQTVQGVCFFKVESRLLMKKNRIVVGLLLLVIGKLGKLCVNRGNVQEGTNTLIAPNSTLLVCICKSCSFNFKQQPTSMTVQGISIIMLELYLHVYFAPSIFTWESIIV